MDSSRHVSRAAVRFNNSPGSPLAGVIHFPLSKGTCPAVIVSHGMLSTKDSPKHQMICDFLALNGFISFRFDFSFRGESAALPGGAKLEDITYTQEVDDLACAAAFLQSFFPREGITLGPIGLTGSSMGAAVSLLYAAQNPEIFAVVGMASVAYPARAKYLSQEMLAQWEKQGFFDTEEGRINVAFLHDARKQDIVGAARKLKAPLRLIHGELDEVVDVSEAREIFENTPGEKSLEILPGADHRFSKEDDQEKIVKLTTQWFVTHRPSLSTLD